MAVEIGDRLTQQLQHNLANRVTDSDFDLAGETEAVLNSVGAKSSESGGLLSFYGRDPIIPSVVRFGAMSAATLAAKAIQIASIWRMRTGRSQDIQVDVRKALRRFSPFIDRRWELLNGYDGGIYSDPQNPLIANMYETKDGMWVFPTNPYPRIHLETAILLNAPSTPEAVARAIKNWNGEDLEQAAVRAGVVMPLARPLRQILKMDVFRKGLRHRPLISVEKIADSDPRPFGPDCHDPLSGIRALGLAHVIAGASIGRALALHGADVLNVWAPEDWEHNLFLYTSHVGTRSTMLRIKDADARAKFMELMGGADVFYSNRRAGYLDRHALGADELCKSFPGLIHAAVIYANDEGGDWSDRVGFDVSTGMAMGLDCLEGTDEKPDHPPIKVVNDYVAGWLATIGVLQALKRRAIEGGSYKVVVSLSRVTLWLLSMGIFDKAYAQLTAGSSAEHTYVAPDQFSAITPMGIYTGVTEQIVMSETPGHYRFVLEPRGSAQPKWL
jgi:crotonobetainyl-CoA:carnitine CoA-transferase CaiB-like acyl-CoA transferase